MNCLFKSGLAAVAGIACLAFSAPAAASPVTYTMFAIADVRLGEHSYHDAQLSLKFVGDTDDVQALPPGTVAGYWISTGTATLQIVSGTHRINAKFKPHQIVVSIDLDNGGAGFSSYVGNPQRFAPAYPLVADGDMFLNRQPDLVKPANYTGYAWSCIDFPVNPLQGGTGSCGDAKEFPLKTDHGDFFVTMVYIGQIYNGLIMDDYSASLNTGIFSVLSGAH